VDLHYVFVEDNYAYGLLISASCSLSISLSPVDELTSKKILSSGLVILYYTEKHWFVLNLVSHKMLQPLNSGITELDTR